MAFSPRTFEQILADMIAYVQAYTPLSDFTVGSVIRTVLEAAALEDDEQYFQMVQLLDSFSLTTASGADLDRRLADFGIARQSAKKAFGYVRFYNSNLVYDELAVDAAVGATTITVFDVARFPTSGFPYTIRVAEGTSRAQSVSVSALNTATRQFTLSTGLLNAAFVADRVTLVTGASAFTINTGATIQAPATVSERARNFTTQEPAYIIAGNLYSTVVRAQATDSGEIGNTGITRVSKFVGSAPFSGARVTNVTAMEGGTNRESDADFRARALERLQTLSRGTPLALRSNAVGVQDPTTGQRVTSANIIEAFDDDEVIVYVDDGSGLTADSSALASSSLATGAGIAGTSLALNDGASFPAAGTVLIEADLSLNPAELVTYVLHPDDDTLTLSTGLLNNHDAGSIVSLVDVVSGSTESGQRRFRVTNYPLVRTSARIFVKYAVATDWTELVADVDYRMNRGTGEFLILNEAGLSTGTQVVAHYSFYTNLIAEVQKVLEGSEDDSVNYPGVKAAGVFLSVEAPVAKRITVTMSLSAQDRFTEADLVAPVRRAVEDYINALKIGEDVIRAKLIDVAFNVSGVKDVVVTNPANNITVLENELPVPYDSAGNSLVSVL